MKKYIISYYNPFDEKLYATEPIEAESKKKAISEWIVSKKGGAMRMTNIREVDN